MVCSFYKSLEGAAEQNISKNPALNIEEKFLFLDNQIKTRKT